MIHAMTFTDARSGRSWNTRDDWGLALQTQPTFSMPPVKTKTLDGPAMGGVIDLTTAITGYPVMGQREGSFQFAAKARQAEWQTLISTLAGILHGQTLRVILDDDPGWYYEGRFALNRGECSPRHAIVTIDYSVGPYAWARESTAEPWLWDPFSFVDGVIGNGTYAASFSASASVTTTALELAYTAQQTGIAFFFPEFTVTGDSDVTLEIKAGDETRATVTLAHGETASVPRLALTEGRWLYKLEPVQVYVSTASGTATLGIAASVNIQNADAFGNIEITTTPKTLDFSAAYPDAGVWPLYAAGDAPVTPEFAATGANVTLTATQDGTQTATKTILAGDSLPWPNLVLYQGGWLYTGRPAELTAATESGTATLAVQFRRGKL